MDNSVFVHKEHTEDKVDHEQSLDADIASTSSSPELQACPKSPLSMVSSPMLECWDSVTLEVCRTLACELVLFLSLNSTLPMPKSPHASCPRMKNGYMCLMKMKGIPSHIL